MAREKAGLLVQHQTDKRLGVVYLRDQSKGDPRSRVTLVDNQYNPIIEDNKQKRVLWETQDFKVIGFVD